MRIQNNIAAMNAHRTLGANNAATAKSLEKLSSGFKINRAGDDAAGLAISEKMRAQIKGLETAQANANDGISLVQTAEGSLTEVHSMLNRMTELATKSANGTMQNEVDREAIQKEVTALTEEIDRIAKGTNFNGIKLLDGSLGSSGANGAGPAFGVQATKAVGKDLAGAILTSSVEGVGVTTTIDKALISGQESATWDATGKALTMNLVAGQTYDQGQIDKLIATATQPTSTGVPADITLKLAGGGMTATEASTTGATVKGVKAESTPKPVGTSGATVTLKSNSYGKELNGAVFSITFDAAPGKESLETTVQYDALAGTEPKFTLRLQAGKEYSQDDLQNMLNSNGVDVSVTFSDDSKKIFDSASTGIGSMTMGSTGAGVSKTDPNQAKGSGGGLSLQIGATSDSFEKVSVNVANMGSSALGIAGMSVGDPASASSAMDKIKSAINKVSDTRAGLGAVQNRLEHTISNLGVSAENMTAAESRIRDVDMAKEMMTFTKNNILTQAAQAMLAQANQQPQGVLQLLR